MINTSKSDCHILLRQSKRGMKSTKSLKATSEDKGLDWQGLVNMEPEWVTTAGNQKSGAWSS